MKRTLLATLLVLATAPQLATAATITVRKDGTGDYMVLQQALDVAASGDTVMVGPGEYTESSMVRLGANGFDQEVFGRIAAANVTLIGAGVGVTIIGPAVYSGNPGGLTPVCIAMDAGSGWLSISEVTLRHCYVGLHVEGTLHADHCEMIDNDLGIVWGNVGSGGWIKDTTISASAPPGVGAAIDFGGLPQGSDITIENCYLGWPSTVRGVQDVLFRNCDLGGVDLYSGARIRIENCTANSPHSFVGVALGANAYCVIVNSSLRDSWAALAIDSSAPGSTFIVDNCRLEGGIHGVFYSRSGAGPSQIRNCDLVKGSGPMVECAFSTTQVTHDLSGNWWGTINEAEIQAWIYDRADNPGRGGLVIYSPFAGQSVPTEATSWGDLKALFR